MADFLIFYGVDVISLFYLFPSSLLISHYFLLFFMSIYKTMISGDWHGFVPQRDAGPCHMDLPPAAAGWGNFSTEGSEPHWGVRGGAEPILGTPALPSHSWETKGTSASYILTCALWSLFSSSCLINCFVSFSSFLLFLIALFVYKRHRGEEKGNQSISMPLQLSSKLPQHDGAPPSWSWDWPLGTVWPHPLPRAGGAPAGCLGQKGNIHVGTFTCVCYACKCCYIIINHYKLLRQPWVSVNKTFPNHKADCEQHPTIHRLRKAPV